jgi:hypothetical protein
MGRNGTYLAVHMTLTYCRILHRVNEAGEREKSEKTILSGVDGQKGGQKGVQNEAVCSQK